MSSLREAIGKVIWKIPYTNAYTVQDYTDTITEIETAIEELGYISKEEIEKRIDSLLEEVKKEREYAFRNDFEELMRETAHAQKYIGQVKEMLSK